MLTIPDDILKQNPSLAAYLKEINEVSTKHKLDLIPALSVTEQGVLPYLKIIELTPPAKPEEPKPTVETAVN